MLRRSSAALLTAALAAALVGVAAPAQAIEPVGAGELPETVELRFGEAVSTETRWFVETAVAEAMGYFARHLSGSGDLDAKIIVVTDVEEAAKAWAQERGISIERARSLFSAGSSDFAGLATTGFTVIINDNYGSAGATLHEFAHLVQRHLSDGSGRGPRWLSEGAAEYFDMAVGQAWGIDAAADGPAAANGEIADEWSATLDNCAADLLPADALTCRWASESLTRLEGAAPFVLGGGAVSAYNRASVAVQVLLDETGEDAYFCYLTAHGAGADWRDAFTDCFGMDVDAFYRHFDRTRSNGFVTQVPSRFPAKV